MKKVGGSHCDKSEETLMSKTNRTATIAVLPLFLSQG